MSSKRPWSQQLVKGDVLVLLIFHFVGRHLSVECGHSTRFF